MWLEPDPGLAAEVSLPRAQGILDQALAEEGPLAEVLGDLEVGGELLDVSAGVEAARLLLDELDEIEVGLDALVVGDRAVARHEGRLTIAQELVAGVGEPGGDRVDIVREKAEEHEVSAPQDGGVVDSNGDVAGCVAASRKQGHLATAEVELGHRVFGDQGVGQDLWLGGRPVSRCASSAAHAAPAGVL